MNVLISLLLDIIWMYAILLNEIHLYSSLDYFRLLCARKNKYKTPL